MRRAIQFANSTTKSLLNLLLSFWASVAPSAEALGSFGRARVGSAPRAGPAKVAANQPLRSDRKLGKDKAVRKIIQFPLRHRHQSQRPISAAPVYVLGAFGLAVSVWAIVAVVSRLL
jgi:hypothetical protein